MNTLRLNIINLHAPYRVWQKSGKPDHYYFVSDSGVEFNIDFKLDYAFVPSGAFEFRLPTNVTDNRHLTRNSSGPSLPLSKSSSSRTMR